MLESKRRAVIFFTLSFILALTAGLLVLQKVRDVNSNLGTMVKVYVAQKDIPSRSLITPDDVTMEEIPKKYLEPYHVTETSELMNKVSVVPLSKGDLIMGNMLKQVSNVVNENDRLVTLMASDRVIFDEPLEALDRVDIIVSEKFTGKEKTSIFMNDIKVARVAKKNSSFKGVMLEVPLAEAPELIHMQNYADSVRILKANVGKEEKHEQVKEQAAAANKQPEPVKKQRAAKKQPEPAKEQAATPKKP